MHYIWGACVCVLGGVTREQKPHENLNLGVSNARKSEPRSSDGLLAAGKSGRIWSPGGDTCCCQVMLQEAGK